MCIHFITVAEPNVSYINMLKLLIFSFRRNGGSHKDAPFTVVFNGKSGPAEEVRVLEDKYQGHNRIVFEQKFLILVIDIFEINQ